MAIEFRCPNCSALLRTPDESAGKKAKCPQCGTIAEISAGSQAPAGAIVPPVPLGEALPSAPSAVPSDNPFGDQARHAAPRESAFESANPYASPPLHDSAFGGAAFEPGRLEATRIQFEELFRRTWQIFSPNFGPCALVGLVMIGFLIGFQVLSMAMGFAAQASGEPVFLVAFQFLNQVFSLLLQTWLNMGIAYVGIQLVRTGRVQVSDFFAIGPYYLRGLGMTFLVALIVFGAVVVCLLPALGILFAQGGPNGIQANPVPIIIAAVLGGLTAIVIATWIMLRAYLGYPFILDRNAGALEALRLSDTYMSGNKLVMFAVLLIVGLVSGMFTCVTCYIGIIFVYPYGGVLTAVAYLTATGQFRAEPKGL
jgi:phage FluMu protein Com